MKIALIGYGKMGKAIEKIAIQRGHTINTIFHSKHILEANIPEDTDIAIEFTQPHLAVVHIKKCIDAKIPVVTGTTGWAPELNEIENYVQSKNGALLHASNFSIGVNIFFAINKKLAKLMADHQEYVVKIEEIHHLQKMDAPSGTAISIANGILENNSNLIEWVSKEGEQPNFEKNQIPISAYRKPDVPGTHAVTYTSPIDTISIHHEAHSREGFAMGAVIAAEWLHGKKGVYTMIDVLNID